MPRLHVFPASAGFASLGFTSLGFTSVGFLSPGFAPAASFDAGAPDAPAALSRGASPVELFWPIPRKVVSLDISL